MNMATAATSVRSNAEPLRLFRPEGKPLPIIDGTKLDPEMIELIKDAHSGKELKSYDHRLYHADSAGIWQRITSSPNYYGGNEKDVIVRSATASAHQIDPNQNVTLVTIGANSKFEEKDGALGGVFYDAGHNVESVIDWDISSTGHNNSRKGRAEFKKRVGIKSDGIDLLGNAFDKDAKAKIKPHIEGIVDSRYRLLEGNQLIVTVFGLTLQNIDTTEVHLDEALEVLKARLSALEKTFPKGTRFFITYDHNKNRSDIMDSYSGDAHDEFLMSAISNNLGPEFADASKSKKFFTNGSPILNRDGVLTRQIAVAIPEGVVLLEKGTSIWHGVSAKFPEDGVISAHEASGLKYATAEPCRDGSGRIACHEIYRPM